MYNTSRCAEIESRFPGLIGAIVNAHKVQLEAKQRLTKASKPRKKSPLAGKA
jgi:hypothetical protein